MIFISCSWNLHTWSCDTSCESNKFSISSSLSLSHSRFFGWEKLFCGIPAILCAILDLCFHRQLFPFTQCVRIALPSPASVNFLFVDFCRRVPLAGHAAREICDVVYTVSARICWNYSNEIYLAKLSRPVTLSANISRESRKLSNARLKSELSVSLNFCHPWNQN